MAWERFDRPLRLPPRPTGIGVGISRIGLCADVRAMLPPDCEAIVLLFDRERHLLAIRSADQNERGARRLKGHGKNHFTAPGFLKWAGLASGFYVTPCRVLGDGLIGGEIPASFRDGGRVCE